MSTDQLDDTWWRIQVIILTNKRCYYYYYNNIAPHHPTIVIPSNQDAIEHRAARWQRDVAVGTRPPHVAAADAASKHVAVPIHTVAVA